LLVRGSRDLLIVTLSELLLLLLLLHLEVGLELLLVVGSLSLLHVNKGLILVQSGVLRRLLLLLLLLLLGHLEGLPVRLIDLGRGSELIQLHAGLLRLLSDASLVERLLWLRARLLLLLLVVTLHRLLLLLLLLLELLLSLEL